MSIYFSFPVISIIMNLFLYFCGCGVREIAQKILNESLSLDIIQTYVSLKFLFLIILNMKTVRVSLREPHTEKFKFLIFDFVHK